MTSHTTRQSKAEWYREQAEQHGGWAEYWATHPQSAGAQYAVLWARLAAHFARCYLREIQLEHVNQWVCADPAF
jgi:hypothetical protein